MPIAEVSEIVLAPLAETYEMICNPENYPQLSTAIHSVQVLERKSRGAKTSWVMEVEGLKLWWDQLDEYCAEEKTLRFRQIAGNMLKFEGRWSFCELSEGTKVSLYLDFDPGVPMLTGILHFILLKKMREITQGLLKGFKILVESTPAAVG